MTSTGDNTANWITCPDCGVLISNTLPHACPGAPWQPVTLSPFTQVIDIETKDYLRRIAEALERLTQPRKPSDPRDDFIQLAGLRTMIDHQIVDVLIEMEAEEKE